MTLRWNDAERTLALGIRDLADRAPHAGDLVLDLAQRRGARLAAGQRAHLGWQGAQGPDYQAEVRLKATIVLEDWTVTLHGRVDGLWEEDERVVIEELKSSALDGERLCATTAADWPTYVAQLQGYLWMAHASGRGAPEGRLVLLGLLDGARHILPVRADLARTDADVRARLRRLVRARDRRNAWLHARQDYRFPLPFPEWRPGQEAMRDAAKAALDAGTRLLVQAPTGTGKTAALLHAALTHAVRTGRRVFWATSRNTQQPGVVATAARLRSEGSPLRAVVLGAKERACLNDVLACRPDTCSYAADHHTRLDALLDAGPLPDTLTPEIARDLGRQHHLCPFALTLEAAATADVVIGDANYVIGPMGSAARVAGEEVADELVVVADEAHQLIERARDHASPRVRGEDVRAARASLQALGPAGAPFQALCDDLLDLLSEAVADAPGPFVDGVSELELALDPWREVADRVDALAFDYALLAARRRGAHTDVSQEDPWLTLARAVLRFVEVAEAADASTRALCHIRPGQEAVRLLCLDPSAALQARWQTLGGFLGCSATLRPFDAMRAQLGLPDDARLHDVDCPFPPERRRVLIADGVSTAWRHRARDADATAALIAATLHAVPGNVAVYTPSFELLRDLATRVPSDRVSLVQRPSMSEDDRRATLAGLQGGAPAVLWAVLGGIFAEGIDLPPGALDAVVVVGPGFPPVGLERTLVQRSCESSFGHGFLHAYAVPGVTRAVQAAGRLIRRGDDRGAIVLIDARWRQPGLRALLPPAWRPDVCSDPDGLREALQGFFAQVPR
jgi:Rad3-related DNA helicase